MRLLCFLVAILAIHLLCTGQGKIQGVVLDTAGVGVSETWVRNINSKQRVKITDENGEFSIRAAIGDTLNFHNFYYREKELVITNYEDLIVSLDKIPGCVLVITEYYSTRDPGMFYGLNYGTVGLFYNTGYINTLFDIDFKLSYGNDFKENDRLILNANKIIKLNYNLDVSTEFNLNKADFDGHQFFNYRLNLSPLFESKSVLRWIPSLSLGYLNLKAFKDYNGIGYGFEDTHRLLPGLFVNGSYMKFDKINQWSIGLKYHHRIADLGIEYYEVDTYQEYSIAVSKFIRF